MGNPVDLSDPSPCICKTFYSNLFYDSYFKCFVFTSYAKFLTLNFIFSRGLRIVLLSFLYVHNYSVSIQRCLQGIMFIELCNLTKWPSPANALEFTFALYGF